MKHQQGDIIYYITHIKIEGITEEEFTDKYNKDIYEIMQSYHPHYDYVDYVDSVEYDNLQEASNELSKYKCTVTHNPKDCRYYIEGYICRKLTYDYLYIDPVIEEDYTMVWSESLDFNCAEIDNEIKEIA